MLVYAKRVLGTYYTLLFSCHKCARDRGLLVLNVCILTIVLDVRW